MEYEALHDVRVLLIDDDEDDYLITKKIVEKIPNQPFILEWCSEYDEAMRLIDANEHDIYLIDYRLGAHTGLDALQYAQPESRSQPFILLTGMGDRGVEWRSLKLAASDYLVKGSFDEETLSRTMYYALQRKNIERQRVEHLLELNRTKDEFISIASHQLRTPATGVKQYLGMVIEGFVGEVPAKQRQLLEKAYDSNERQLRIIADLLRVAQVDSGKLKLRKSSVAIDVLVQDVIAEQSDTVKGRHQEIEFTPPSKRSMLNIDADAIRMVLENIIDNASKYSFENSTVYVELFEEEEKMCVRVSDSGVGVVPHELNRLFEKFARIENPLSTKVGGSGLGLYWAKRIVDMHGGRIEYKSNEPRGSIFSIYLPLE